MRTTHHGSKKVFGTLIWAPMRPRPKAAPGHWSVGFRLTSRAHLRSAIGWACLVGVACAPHSSVIRPGSSAPSTGLQVHHEPLPWAVAAMVDLGLADTTRGPEVGCYPPTNAGLDRFRTRRSDHLWACDVVRDSVDYYVYIRRATGEILAAGRELPFPDTDYAPVVDSMVAGLVERLGPGDPCAVDEEGRHGWRWLVPGATVLLVASPSPRLINLEAQRGHVTCNDILYVPATE